MFWNFFFEKENKTKKKKQKERKDIQSEKENLFCRIKHLKCNFVTPD